MTVRQSLVLKSVAVAVMAAAVFASPRVAPAKPVVCGFCANTAEFPYCAGGTSNFQSECLDHCGGFSTIACGAVPGLTCTSPDFAVSCRDGETRPPE
jgi:hypothetical protein